MSLPLVVLTVQFDPVNYDVIEGEQASLVAVLSFAADRPVTVDFATNDDSATGINVQDENPKPPAF